MQNYHDEQFLNVLKKLQRDQNAIIEHVRTNTEISKKALRRGLCVAIKFGCLTFLQYLLDNRRVTIDEQMRSYILDILDRMFDFTDGRKGKHYDYFAFTGILTVLFKHGFEFRHNEDRQAKMTMIFSIIYGDKTFFCFYREECGLQHLSDHIWSLSSSVDNATLIYLLSKKAISCSNFLAVVIDNDNKPMIEWIATEFLDTVRQVITQYNILYEIESCKLDTAKFIVELFTQIELNVKRKSRTLEQLCFLTILQNGISTEQVMPFIVKQNVAWYSNTTSVVGMPDYIIQLQNALNENVRNSMRSKMRNVEIIYEPNNEMRGATFNNYSYLWRSPFEIQHNDHIIAPRPRLGFSSMNMWL